MNYDQAAIDLLLAGDQAGLKRLAVQASRVISGNGDACDRCGNDSYQVSDDGRECDNCGLGEGMEDQS